MHPAVLTFAAVALLGAGLWEWWLFPRRRAGHVLERSDALRESRANPWEDGLLRGLARWLGGRIRPWLPSSQLEQLREQLLWAGQPLGLTAEEFFFARWGLALAGALVVPLLGIAGSRSQVLGGMAVAAGVGYLVPDRLLSSLVAERTRQIRIQLPHFVQLLATALEAGLPIFEAVRRVAAEQPGLLAAEMLRTVQEMAAGKPAAQAWQHLMRRTACQELREVVTAIIQSQELGVGVAQQLRFQMRTIRARKQQEAHEKAQAASVKMRVPTIVFIMVPTMVILLGPAVVVVFRQLTGG